MTGSRPGARPTFRRPLLGGAVAALAVGCLLLVRPASAWLAALAPDGALEPRTAAFLDSLAGVVLLSGIVLLAAALSTEVRAALAGAAREPRPPEAEPSRWLGPAVAVFAFGLRIAVAARTDIGLGDDGARVSWLLEWWQDPHPVWSGLWLPAHLYLHALLFAVVRDAVWSGVLLSALSAGGTVWILARALEPGWGRWAAGCGALGAALLPVSVAHGATPDVNPVFAFALVASMAAVRRGVQRGRDRWVVVGWACIAAGTWMRFEALLLVPLVALMLWPRRLAALWFAAAGAAPLVFWNLVAPALLGRESTVEVMSRDPTLGGSPLSLAFSYLGAVWVAVTLPVLLLGCAGMARAVRARTDRAWMLLPWGHAAALAGALVVLAAGTQPRYFILIATVAAAYAGLGFAGIAARSRRAGLVALGLAAVLLVVTPPLYPSRHDLWIRRDTVLRTLVDDTARLAAGRHVVWVGDAGFFYACRIRPPQERYHSLPRADSDLGLAVTGIGAAPSAVAVVEQSALARQRWDRFLALSSPGWRIEPRFDRGDYRVFELTR